MVTGEQPPTWQEHQARHQTAGNRPLRKGNPANSLMGNPSEVDEFD